MAFYSQHTGAQVDEAVDKVLASPISMMSNRNLLDNWYFVGGGSQQGGGQFPINQRGQTVYSAGDYGIDRWVMYAPSGNLQSDGLHLSANESIAQKLESGLLDSLVGKTVTASVLTSDGECLYGTISSFPASGGAYFTSSGSVQVLINDSFSPRAIQFFANQNVTVAAVKLELGSNQTLAHQENGVWVLNEIPSFAEELLKCQRYFYRYNGLTTACALSGSTVTACTIPFPVTMLGVPAIANITYYDSKVATGQGAFVSGVRFYNSNSVSFSVTGFDASADL